MLDNFVKFCF